MKNQNKEITKKPPTLKEIVLFLREGGHISDKGNHSYINNCSILASGSLDSKDIPVDNRSYLEIALDIVMKFGSKDLADIQTIIEFINDIYLKETKKQDGWISHKSYWCLLAEIDLASTFGKEKEVDTAIERLLHFYYLFSCNREEWWRLEPYIINQSSNTTKEKILAYRLKNNNYTPEIFSLLKLIGRKITIADVWTLIETDQRKGYHNFESHAGIEYVKIAKGASGASDEFTMKVLRAFKII